MKNVALIFLLFGLNCLSSAQAIQEKKFYSDQGQLIEIARITKIDEVTDAFEVTTFNPENSGLKLSVINFKAIKAKKENSPIALSELLSPSLKEYMQFFTVYEHGKSMRYHDNGKIKQEEHYVYGILEGPAAEYDANANIISKGSYSKGEKDGEWIIYFVTDNTYYRKGHYKNGVKEGVWGTYLANGTLITEEKFIKGELDVSFVPSVIANYAATGPCPDPKKLRGLCAVVGDLTEDSNPQGKYKYMYQRRIFEAACVNVNIDSEEMIAAKVSKVWKDNEDRLICNSTRFEVSNGNIIKFAVDMTFDSFISDMVLWKVDLNKVDETDGRTVLDYVQYQIERAKGSALEPRISFYYRTLKLGGAKHKHEL